MMRRDGGCSFPAIGSLLKNHTILMLNQHVLKLTIPLSVTGTIVLDLDYDAADLTIWKV